MEPVGRQQKERVLDRVRLGDEQRTLAAIVDQQRRQHEDEPRRPDRRSAEMAEVGIHRLAAGDRQEHRAQYRRRTRAERGVRDEQEIGGPQRGSTRISTCGVAPRCSPIGEQLRSTTNQHEHHRSEDAPDKRHVPRDWTRNSPTRMTIVIGSDEGARATGASALRPSIGAQHRDRRRDRRRRRRARAAPMRPSDQQQPRCQAAGLRVHACSSNASIATTAAFAMIVRTQDEQRHISGRRSGSATTGSARPLRWPPPGSTRRRRSPP